MFRFGRRRQQERDEFLMMHSKIAAIHGDLLRRDEELLRTLSSLSAAAHQVGERLASDASMVDVLNRLLVAGETPAIDLTKERVLGGSVSVEPAAYGQIT